MRTRNNGQRRANQLVEGGDDIVLELPPPTRRRRRAPSPTTSDSNKQSKIARIEENHSGEGSEEIDDVPSTDEDTVLKLSQ